MKNIVFLFLVILFTGPVVAQVPQNINYQAVARNNNGQALANQTIKTRLSIMSGATSLYSETRSVTTNGLGLFNVRIGSPGTISTSGSFTTINWTSNQPEVKLIKVELDINNTNVFTDMGSQTLATVPYAFSASEAINAINIGGNYVDTNTPQLNNVLKWNGSAWAPSALPTVPIIYSIASTIATIPPGGGAPWTLVGNSSPDSYATVTVVHGQTITANFVGVFGHTNSNAQPCSFAVCYEQVVSGIPTGNIYAFQNTNYTDGTIDLYPNKSTLTATGAVKVVTGTNLPTAHQIPPGTYRVFMGMKNKATSVPFGANDYVNGTIIVF